MNEVHFLQMFPTNCRRPRGGGATIWRKQNERSSFFINVSDELPPTKGRGRNNMEETK